MTYFSVWLFTFIGSYIFETEELCMLTRPRLLCFARNYLSSKCVWSAITSDRHLKELILNITEAALPSQVK